MQIMTTPMKQCVLLGIVEIKFAYLNWNVSGKYYYYYYNINIIIIIFIRFIFFVLFFIKYLRFNNKMCVCAWVLVLFRGQVIEESEWVYATKKERLVAHFLVYLIEIYLIFSTVSSKFFNINKFIFLILLFLIVNELINYIHIHIHFLFVLFNFFFREF